MLSAGACCRVVMTRVRFEVILAVRRRREESERQVGVRVKGTAPPTSIYTTTTTKTNIKPQMLTAGACCKVVMTWVRLRVIREVRRMREESERQVGVWVASWHTYSPGVTGLASSRRKVPFSKLVLSTVEGSGVCKFPRTDDTLREGSC